MRPWIAILLAFVAVANGQRILSIQTIPLKPESGPDSVTCGQKCRSTYSPHTNEEGSNGLSSCETGCRFLSLIETVDSNYDALEDKKEGTTNNVLENCNKSCEASFKDEKDEYACKLGCSFQLPISQERRNKVADSLDDFFDNIGFGLPRIRIGFPESDSKLNNMFTSMPSFDDMFHNMRNHMNNMMERLMSPTKDLEDGELPAFGGKGRMVVIKSGPGYHQEKTYDFGPDGVKTETKVQGEPIENDMMTEMNPMEKFFKKDMVELFNPQQTKENESESPEKPKSKGLFDFVFDSVHQKKEEDPEDTFDVEFVPKKDNSRSTVRGFDFDLEEPRLPEEGLRTRPYSHVRHIQYVCSQDSENMKWSDWVSCLHVRMGLPRWLTAATISLGIVFVIWLCLVIPQNAPKQRVKLTKAQEAARDLEKANLNIILPYPNLDKPPSYDDIANLHVAIPVNTTASEEQAEALPEKKNLEENQA